MTCTIHSLSALAMISLSSQKNADSERLICKSQKNRIKQIKSHQSNHVNHIHQISCD